MTAIINQQSCLQGFTKDASPELEDLGIKAVMEVAEIGFVSSYLWTPPFWLAELLHEQLLKTE